METINKLDRVTNLLNTFTLNEDERTLWTLEERRFMNEGRRLWVLFCERNGEEMTGTRQTFSRLDRETKELFGL